jgi:hypothetical protein
MRIQSSTGRLLLVGRLVVPSVFGGGDCLVDNSVWASLLVTEVVSWSRSLVSSAIGFGVVAVDGVSV